MSNLLYVSPTSENRSHSKTKKCVVFDVDLTLVCSSDKIDEFNKIGLNNLNDPKFDSIRDRIYAMNIDTESDPIKKKTFIWGIIRPYWQEFLTYCFSYFDVIAVWSAGEERYVEEMVNILFKGFPKPHVVYARGMLEIIPGAIDGRINKHKPLSKMFNNVPGLNNRMNLYNTIIVDDIIDNFYANRDNGVEIPQYSPPLTLDGLKTNDIAFLQLMRWLDRRDVIETNDIRLINKRDIFKIPLDQELPLRAIDNNSNLYQSFSAPTLKFENSNSSLKEMKSNIKFETKTTERQISCTANEEGDELCEIQEMTVGIPGGLQYQSGSYVVPKVDNYVPPTQGSYVPPSQSVQVVQPQSIQTIPQGSYVPPSQQVQIIQPQGTYVPPSQTSVPVVYPTVAPQPVQTIPQGSYIPPTQPIQIVQPQSIQTIPQGSYVPPQPIQVVQLQTPRPTGSVIQGLGSLGQRPQSIFSSQQGLVPTTPGYQSQGFPTSAPSSSGLSQGFPTSSVPSSSGFPTSTPSSSGFPTSTPSSSGLSQGFPTSSVPSSSSTPLFSSTGFPTSSSAPIPSSTRSSIFSPITPSSASLSTTQEEPISSMFTPLTVNELEGDKIRRSSSINIPETQEQEQIYIPEIITPEADMSDNRVYGSPSPKRSTIRLLPLSNGQSVPIKNGMGTYNFPYNELMINSFPTRSTPIVFPSTDSTNSIFKTVRPARR